MLADLARAHRNWRGGLWACYTVDRNKYNCFWEILKDVILLGKEMVGRFSISFIWLSTVNISKGHVIWSHILWVYKNIANKFFSMNLKWIYCHLYPHNQQYQRRDLRLSENVNCYNVVSLKKRRKKERQEPLEFHLDITWERFFFPFKLCFELEITTSW